MIIDEEGRPICEVCNGTHDGWTQDEASSDNSVYEPCLQNAGCTYCSCGPDQPVPCTKHFLECEVICSICSSLPMSQLGVDGSHTVVEVAHAQLEAIQKMLVDMLRSPS